MIQTNWYKELKARTTVPESLKGTETGEAEFDLLLKSIAEAVPKGKVSKTAAAEVLYVVEKMSPPTTLGDWKILCLSGVYIITAEGEVFTPDVNSATKSILGRRPGRSIAGRYRAALLKPPHRRALGDLERTLEEEKSDLLGYHKATVKHLFEDTAEVFAHMKGSYDPRDTPSTEELQEQVISLHYDFLLFNLWKLLNQTTDEGTNNAI